MQISQILKQGIQDLQNVGVSHPQLEAEILLLHAIGQNRSREWLIANPDFEISNETMKQYSNFIERRMKFEPIAYIINRKEFYGYEFYIDKRVLIPRPESEILVEKSKENILYRQYSTFHILELGTGSSCIIISLIKELQKQKFDLSLFKFLATDISEDALAVARKNAETHKVDQFIQFVQSDLFDSLNQLTINNQQLKFDLIIANLPYVPSYWIQDGPTEYGLVHEPKISLNGGKEGLDVYKRFFKEVPKFLSKSGTILIECEDDQIDKILEILKDLKYKFSHQVFKDYNNLQRVVQIDKIIT